MFLSRLHLNPRSRQVRRDIVDCHQLHRTVMVAFPDLDGGRAGASILHRLESDRNPAVLYVQSALEPRWDVLPGGYLHQDWMGDAVPAVRPLDAAWGALRAGQQLRFRLLANPVQRLRTDDRSSGPRVPIRDPQQQLEWLARKAERGGFTLLSTREDSAVPAVQAVEAGARHGRRVHNEGKRRLTFAGVLFDGRLQIDEPDAFRRTLREGLGPAKAYGYGLMSIAP